jgi:putative hydrolase of the HAD superfamily
MTIRGLIVDLDNTLYSYAEAHNPAQRELEKYLANRLGQSDQLVRAGLSASRLIIKTRLSDTGSSHSRLLYISEYLQSINCPGHVELALSAESIYWIKYLDSMRIDKGVENFLQTSRHAGYLNILVTDLTSEIQYRKLRILAIDNLFDVTLTSEEAGGDKKSGRPEEVLRNRFDVISGFCVGDQPHDHLFQDSTEFFMKNRLSLKSSNRATQTFKDFDALQKKLFKYS